MGDVRKKNIVAIIPARGGSKRIPNKNIKLFCGKPLISYPISMLKSCDLISQVLVSTDSQQIKKESLLHGAIVPFMRPKKLSDDYATTADAIIHALHWLIENETTHIDYVLTIYPAATSITEEEIEKAIFMIEDGDVDSVFTTLEFPHPIQRAFVQDSKGYVNMIADEERNKRTQDLDNAFHDAGQFYLTKANKLLEEKEVVSKKSKHLVLDKKRFVDIDSIEDFIHAENLYRIYNS
jgi:N-acylneuraminate cytidylyltransferase